MRDGLVCRAGRWLAASAVVVLAMAFVAVGAPPAGATADGPDFWIVQGVPKGDTLNVRSGPSISTPILRQLPNGYVLRNLGCNPQRWCHVQAPDASFKGWAYGQYLRESGAPVGPPGLPPGLPPGFPPGYVPGFPPGYVPGLPPGQEVPVVVPRPGGELEVRWRNGCTVLFDRFGKRISAGGSCTQAHKDQSAEAVRRYLDAQGGPGGRPPGGGAVAVGQMAAYCLGEAAGYFRVKPGALRTNPPFANGRGHTVIGWFEKQPARGFRCTFRKNGTFEGVFE